MRNRYTKGMTKKIDLNNLFNIIEEDPLILNIEDMNFDERTTLFDKLYQDSPKERFKIFVINSDFLIF